MPFSLLAKHESKKENISSPPIRAPCWHNNDSWSQQWSSLRGRKIGLSSMTRTTDSAIVTDH